MKIYEFNCHGIECKGESEIIFSADGFPLEQNCDVAHLCVSYGTASLTVWYDDGTKRADYSTARAIYVDGDKRIVDIYVADEILQEGQCPAGFEIIRITLKNDESLYALKTLFAFDKMINLIDKSKEI